MSKYLFQVCVLFTTFLCAQNSLKFNGEAFVSIDNPSFTDFVDTSFAVEFVISNYSNNNNKQIILDYFKQGQGFKVFVKSNDEFVVKFNKQNYVIPNFSLDNGCHHISIVRSKWWLKFYVDGELVGSDFMFQSCINVPSNAALFIGGKPNGKNNFIGELDEIRLYKNARNSNQIQANLFNSVTTQLKALQAYYNFDSIANQVVKDQSIYSNNGVLGNSGKNTDSDPMVIGQSCVTPISLTQVNCGAISYKAQPYLSYEKSTQMGVDDSSRNSVGIYDSYGNRYAFENIEIDSVLSTTNKTVFPSCSSGYFTLHFATGSGMESTTDPIHADRRSALCQVFSDIAKLISSPLTSTGGTVHIWIRNFNDLGISANALGTASSFMSLPLPSNDLGNPSIINGGIADNEVWKTINSGIDSYTNTGLPLISETGSNTFYHGMMAMNFNNVSWNTDTSLPIISGIEYDFYSVALHEVLHLLGMASLVASDGNSKLGVNYNYYSRYDTFLNDPNGSNLISSSGCNSMYDYSFTGSISSVNPLSCIEDPNSPVDSSHDCNNIVSFIGTSTIPVFNPSCFSSGSSLSHFEDACYPINDPYGNNLYFVMSNTSQQGVVKRIIKREELQVLCDLGYPIKAIGCNPMSVVGINDRLDTPISGFTNIPMTLSGILSNDVNATGFECLEDVYDASATFSTTNGDLATNLTYTTSTAGLHLLRYVPVNGSLKGNITYVYLWIAQAPLANLCSSSLPCELVVNGDFEQYSSIPNGVSQLSLACNWGSANLATPDYYHRLSTNTFSGFTTPLVGVPNSLASNYPNDTNQTVNNANGDAYIGMYCNYNNNSDLYSESIKTKLSTALTPNTNYQLTFDVSFAVTSLYDNSGLQFQAFLSALDLLAPNYGNIPINSASNPDPNGIFLENSQPITTTNNWTTITFTFNSGNGGQEYLYLGGLIDPTLSSGLTQSTGGYTFLDNVSLSPVNPCEEPYISQIYEDGDRDYIEIKNPDTNNNIPPGTYYLAYYQNGSDTALAPTASMLISSSIPANTTVYFTGNGDPDINPNINALEELPVGLDHFDGNNDIVILTTTNDETAFTNRVDLVGDHTDWGSSRTLLRSSCALEYPRKDTYEVCDWAEVTLTEATSSPYTQTESTNVVLGRHRTEVLAFNPDVVNPGNGIWEDNLGPGLSAPDHSRAIEIRFDYDMRPIPQGDDLPSFQACSVAVIGSNTLTVDSHDFVRIQQGIRVEPSASLAIQDQGSLVMVRDACYGMVGSDLIHLASGGFIEVNATTKGIDSQLDYVFWSSPLTQAAGNSTIEQLFPSSLFLESRFFGFNNANFFDHYSGPYEQSVLNPVVGGVDGFSDSFIHPDYYPISTTSTPARNQPMIPGQGYSTWSQMNTDPTNGNYSIVFSGQVNNGVVTTPVFQNNAAGENTNLVGNPYPSPIDLDVFLQENNNIIEPVVFIWGRGALDTDSETNEGPLGVNYSTDDIMVYSPMAGTVVSPLYANSLQFNDPDGDGISNSGLLASCQSFFVNTLTNGLAKQDPLYDFNAPGAAIPKIIQPAGVVTFNNKMRSVMPNTTFVKMQQPKEKLQQPLDHTLRKLWLNLVNKEASLGSQIAIVFSENTTDQYSNKEDIRVPYGRKLNFYTNGTEKDLIIDCQSNFNTSKEIPLGITQLNGNEEELTISIDNTQGFKNQAIYLEDTVLNTMHNLSISDYSFTAKGGVLDNRFVIKFVNEAFKKERENLENVKQIQMYTKANKVYISSFKRKIQQVVIHDIYSSQFGCQIAHKKQINTNELSLPLGAQYKLIEVRVLLENGTWHHKKLML